METTLRVESLTSLKRNQNKLPKALIKKNSMSSLVTLVILATLSSDLFHVHRLTETAAYRLPRLAERTGAKRTGAS